LFGDPESGKTFLAIDWALSVATGQKTFGLTCTPGRVLYMSGEGNARITSRVHAWITHHGIEVDKSRFLLTGHVPDILNDQVMENLGREVARREIDLVIIDTLGRAMAIGGGDISAPSEASLALKNLQVVSSYRTSTTVVALHHKVKSGGMAGAYSLLGGVDVALEAIVPEGSTEGELKFAKNKDGKKANLFSYQWKDSGRSAVLVPVDNGWSGGSV
jgi:RecA-family ATPase